ncbi:MAG: bifunctional alpha,alpha-trehalose-phosphate synthase (UDP-forming)/trehalose-phosphatase [Tannerella sp.]|jgi:trehalose 6-phosphate synthase/phosphatase|nr:bifunctional alpha,alpha-trehalose-phosphate synthase (UDP-forming)/trehalose-phosphatase [Tannerella sp.]
MKLVIISNRLPLTIVEENNEYKVTPSAGGLATGLNSLEITLEKHWIGWPGIYITDQQERKKVDALLSASHFHPVYLTPEEIENYYEGYSNSVIWPLFHYFFSFVRYRDTYWNTYKEVNKLFCEKALEIIEPGDIVWVQDYHLMLLPRMLREKMSDAIIGYFHHIPFPSYELFRTLPERAEILNGLLGADLVAFHIHSYVYHFINAVSRIIKSDCHLNEIYSDNRIVNVDAFSMGINYDMYHDAILNPTIRKKADEFRKEFGDCKIIISVDRLDYSKGIPMRLKSFKNFLMNHPEYHKKVSLVMIVSPSRDKVDIYAGLKEKIDRRVGEINGKFATVGWQPVYYYYHTFGFKEIVALYHISDIGLVTSFRDGMNLVAKEYVAAKRDGKGVLILSELAGASIELSDAITVNPTNMKDLEDAIYEALEMPEEEQATALENMQESLRTQHIGQWAKDFIDELILVNKKNEALQQKIINKTNFDHIKLIYDQSVKRLIILDYDGTLSAFHSNPKKAYPTPGILELLKAISDDASNKVVISSGRNRQTLEEWFGYLPIGLAAEHGAFYKENGQWHSKVETIEWDNEITNILKQVVRKTPRSKLEIKETTLVWHYRDVDNWLAELRVTQLINELNNLCSIQSLQIMKGNKIVEIKPSEFSKGKEALRLMEQGKYDFIMAIGDDTTDEEMFAMLPSDAITIKVGTISRIARYNIPNQQQIIPFLNNLII